MLFSNRQNIVTQRLKNRPFFSLSKNRNKRVLSGNCDHTTLYIHNLYHLMAGGHVVLTHKEVYHNK